MLGDREAIITELKTFPLHGVTYFDLVLRFDDGRTLSARLGAESVPPELASGDRVIASLAANMVVALRKP
ncbi:MAG TPA: hypothetical protein VEA19_08090 [Actinomycetota bacterium]|nr:hypothetical protein [Actinomycetota bacterium]